MLVIGCKKDLVEGNKVKQLALNQKVLKELKKVDQGDQIDYFETGMSLATSAYRVPLDDLQLFMGKLFDNQDFV